MFSTPDVEQGDDRAAVLGLHGEHLLEQVVAGVDQVVAEQHRERLVADERGRLQHGVPEPLGLALADEVHLRDVGGLVHRGQPAGVALLLQRRLELGRAVEEVLDGRLVAAGDHEHLAAGPARAASSTMYCSAGRSTTGSSSLGTALVAGRNRVPIPATGMTAFVADAAGVVGGGARHARQPS